MAYGARGQIRTDTERGLKPPTLPLVYSRNGAPGTDSNLQPPASKAGASTNWATGALVSGEGVEPPMFTTEGSDLQSDATPPSLPPARGRTRMVRQYRKSMRMVVGAAGFEPAISRLPRPAGTANLPHAPKVGRGRESVGCPFANMNRS